jgi:hypothetical protein
MRQIRVSKPKRVSGCLPDLLALDLRDSDIVRAKQLAGQTTYSSSAGETHDERETPDRTV